MASTSNKRFTAKICELCKFSYKPASPNQKICSSCKAAMKSTPKSDSGIKRGNDLISPPVTTDEKKSKQGPLSPETILHAVSAIPIPPLCPSETSVFNLNLEEVKLLDKDQLFAIIFDLKRALDKQSNISLELSAKCATLENDTSHLKLALADKVLYSFHSQTIPAPKHSYADIAKLNNPSTSRASIVAKTTPNSRNIDPATIDSFLGAPPWLHASPKELFFTNTEHTN